MTRSLVVIALLAIPAYLLATTINELLHSVAHVLAHIN